jgi:hypothetical protein
MTTEHVVAEIIPRGKIPDNGAARARAQLASCEPISV